MINGWPFLGIGAFVGASDLVMAQVAARSIARRTDAMPAPDGQSRDPLAGVRILRIAAVMIFLIFAAIAFGLIPTAFVQPIKLH